MAAAQVRSKSKTIRGLSIPASGEGGTFVESAESCAVRWEGGRRALRYGSRRGSGSWRSGASGRRWVARDGSWAPGGGEAFPGTEWPEFDEEALEVWVRGVAEGLRGRSGTVGVAGTGLRAAAGFYRQSVRWIERDREVSDVRGGVRVSLFAGSAPLGPVTRRYADRTVDSLCRRIPAAAAAEDLAASLALWGEAPLCPGAAHAVVFAPGQCGALVHEIGHLFEADHARRASRPLAYGERAASGPITILDDPGSCAGRGAYAADDEGNLPAPVALLHAGIVVGILGDPGGGQGDPSGAEGHLRRGSWKDPAWPRLACTILQSGADSPADLLRHSEGGICVRSIRSANVEPASGVLTLLVEEAYGIEQGRPSRPCVPFAVVVAARELLSRIDGVGDDLCYDHGVGDCLKRDQAIPVTVGMPTVRVAGLKVVVL